MLACICLERGADLHMAQLMPLPLTVSCSSKIQIGFTFVVLTHPGSPGHRAVNGCVCVSTNRSKKLPVMEALISTATLVQIRPEWVGRGRGEGGSQAPSYVTGEDNWWKEWDLTKSVDKSTPLVRN